jgi:hypothetical protein
MVPHRHIVVAAETLEFPSIGVPAIELDTRIRGGSKSRWAQELGMKLSLKVKQLSHKMEIGRNVRLLGSNQVISVI